MFITLTLWFKTNKAWFIKLKQWQNDITAILENAEKPYRYGPYYADDNTLATCGAEEVDKYSYTGLRLNMTQVPGSYIPPWVVIKE